MTQEQQDLLLKVARDSLAATVRGEPPNRPSEQLTGIDCGGAFVTLRNKGRLRGCMGSFSPDPDIVRTIQSTAVSAARDPRFEARPIRSAELAEINIEISILSRPEPTDDPLSLELGTHGILIENPRGRGCFLPQVATEFGWSADELLRRCCRDKAQLEADAWKDRDTKVSLFAAEVFSER